MALNFDSDWNLTAKTECNDATVADDMSSESAPILLLVRGLRIAQKCIFDDFTHCRSLRDVIRGFSERAGLALCEVGGLVWNGRLQTTRMSRWHSFLRLSASPKSLPF
jgi:hypothetical protein